MPIFTYHCDYCNHSFDALVLSHNPEDRATKECTKCKSKAKKVFSAPAQARGNFGTPRRSGSRENVQKFNFEPEDNE